MNLDPKSFKADSLECNEYTIGTQVVEREMGLGQILKEDM
jgi:hypothetical protein